MQTDEFSSCSLGAHEEMDFVPPDVENTQEDTNTAAAMSNIQDSVQTDDKLSNESDYYVIENIDFSHPVSDKTQANPQYLDLVSELSDKRNKKAIEHDDSDHYTSIATIKSGAYAASTHQITQLHDRDTTTSRSIEFDDTPALTEESTHDDKKSLPSETKQSDYYNIPELRRIHSTTDSYVYMHKVKLPTLKRNSDVYTYDYIYHSYIEMCRHRKRCSGVPPRNIKRIGYQPSTDVQETYVNFRIIETHAITSLPQREDHKRPIPKKRTIRKHPIRKPPLPPRNIPRPGCYLTAPRAIPT